MRSGERSALDPASDAAEPCGVSRRGGASFVDALVSRHAPAGRIHIIAGQRVRAVGAGYGFPVPLSERAGDAGAVLPSAQRSATGTAPTMPAGIP